MYKAPSPRLGLSVVIPCYNEPDILQPLEALRQCTPPDCDTEVVVVINSPAGADPDICLQNQLSLTQIQNWQTQWAALPFELLVLNCSELPPKIAGVGLARRLGMDLAASRLAQIGRPDGVIACLDADCSCDSNYLVALENHFRQSPRTPGCAIYFEHPLAGPEDPAVYQAIVWYELFLRYYVRGLAYAGLPYAFQTVGSAMAVRSGIYLQQGGMNRRKAGEDFYFLHKIIPLGHFSELTQTRILPSPRISDRVPFGTGRSIGDSLRHQRDLSLGYSPQTFADLKGFHQQALDLYPVRPESLKELKEKMPHSFQMFLKDVNLSDKILEFQSNSTSRNTFYKRFYDWFNAFKTLKYVHFVRDHVHSEVSLLPACQQLLSWMGYTDLPDFQAIEWLKYLRRLDRGAVGSGE